jgi:hypothetical protein
MTPTRLLFLTLGLLFSAASMALSSPPSNETFTQALTVSEVVANRNALFGRKIAVSGYVALDFENINLYQSRSEYKRNGRNCITLGVNRFFQKEGPKYRHKLVVVVGVLQPNYVKAHEVCLACCSPYAIIPIAISLRKASY